MEKQELESLIEEHISISRMAKATGRSKTTIRYWLKVWGLQSKGNEERQRIKPLCGYCGIAVKRHERTYCSNRCQMKAARQGTAANNLHMGMPRLKNYLIDCRGRRCEVCGIREWRGQPAPIELDHIDGNPLNNGLDNVRLICPNCHAQTKTNKGRNKGGGRYARRQRYAQGKSF